MTTPKNPQGQYQVPPGYRPQTQAAPWSGSYKGSQPRIKGVSALQAVAIKNDWRNKTGLPGSAGPSSQRLAEQAEDQEAAHQAERQTAFEKGYENMRKTMGYGPQQAPPPALTPEQHQRKQLILGGLQPHEADAAVAQTKAKAAATAATAPPPAPSAANPTPGAPAPAPTAPVAAPGTAPAAAPAAPVAAPARPASTATVGPDGRGGSLGDWIAANKARQANPELIGPSADDAAALTSAQAHVAAIAKTNAPLAAAAQAMRPAVDPQQASVARNEQAHAQQVQDQIYPEKSAKVQAGVKAIQARTDAANAKDISSLGFSMRPDTMGPGYNPSASAAAGAQGGSNTDDIKEPEARAMGGPVTSVKSTQPPTWLGAAPVPPAAPPQPGGAYPAARRSGTVSERVGVLGPNRAPLYLKKGGPASSKNVYRVGEKGPELFMPNKQDSPPVMVGQDGPETGVFPEDGTVIPNHALKQMRGKFAKQKTDDDDQDGAPPAMAAARNKMRPQAA